MAIDRNILGVSIMDMNGHLLSSSKHLMEGSLEKSFSEKYYSLWTKIILWLVQEIGQDFGPVKAIVNFHENCIVELVPVKSRQLIIGLFALHKYGFYNL